MKKRDAWILFKYLFLFGQTQHMKIIWKILKWIWIWILSIFILGVVVSVLTENAVETKKQTAKQNAKVMQLWESASVPWLADFSVTKAEKTDLIKSHNQFYKDMDYRESPTATFYLVDIQINNTELEAFWFNRYRAPFIIEDSKGRKYDPMDCSFWSKACYHNVNFKPGIPEWVQAIFEIPRDATWFNLVVPKEPVMDKTQSWLNYIQYKFPLE